MSPGGDLISALALRGERGCPDGGAVGPVGEQQLEEKPLFRAEVLRLGVGGRLDRVVVDHTDNTARGQVKDLVGDASGDGFGGVRAAQCEEAVSQQAGLVVEAVQGALQLLRGLSGLSRLFLVGEAAAGHQRSPPSARAVAASAQPQARVTPAPPCP
jgi:hypothetical protein